MFFEVFIIVKWMTIITRIHILVKISLILTLALWSVLFFLQIVVLARVIVDRDQVLLTANGVTILVRKLNSDNDNVIVLASSLLSSLAHTRAGIPDAMVTTGAIDELVKKLSSSNELVRSAVAVALGYLTFNPTAARLLLSECRNMPGLYKQLMKSIDHDAKISQDFIENFKRAKTVGLPSQW